jgi:protein O-mannosyl-transferase
LRDKNLQADAKQSSVLVASLWLLLPQHISTVFYVIQRMSILAALFAVIACWLYVVIRERVENKTHYHWPVFGIALFTLLSVLSKESGLFIPLYCLLIEWIYFRPSIDKPRPAFIAWAFRLGVLYPCLLVAAYLAFNPGFVLAPYINREFSMPERALTQLSVMADYFASTFIPMVRSAGVFNDDFPIADHLGRQEILILIAGIGLIFAAIRLRKGFPSFSAGIGIFFIGHLLESSIFSLEIYFSHRNYMPSIGLVLAASGLISGLLSRYPQATHTIKRLLPLSLAALFIVYGMASLNRATLWSSNANIMNYAQLHHPSSSRLRSELLLNALYSKQLESALQQADIAMQTSPANEKRTIQLWRILAYCYVEQPIPANELQALYHMPADRITLATSTAINYVSAAAEANACPGLDRPQLGKMINDWTINTVQTPNIEWVWRTHLAAARLFAASGDLKTGFKQAQWAFNDSGYDFNAGVLALQLANSMEDRSKAQAILHQLNTHQSKYSALQKSQLQELKTH